MPTIFDDVAEDSAAGNSDGASAAAAAAVEVALTNWRRVSEEEVVCMAKSCDGIGEKARGKRVQRRLMQGCSKVRRNGQIGNPRAEIRKKSEIRNPNQESRILSIANGVRAFSGFGLWISTSLAASSPVCAAFTPLQRAFDERVWIVRRHPEPHRVEAT